MVHFYDGSSQFIVKHIYWLDSEGAHTSISWNETTFQALEVNYCLDFVCQLPVDCQPIFDSES